MNTNATSIFKDSGIAIHLSYLNEKTVVIPADKAPQKTSSFFVNHITQTA